MADRVIEQGAAPKLASTPLWAILGGVAVVIAGVAYILLFTGQGGDLRQCDKAIREDLKAPATYRRIDAQPSSGYGLRIYDVTYDAENAFGVPLRSTGRCSLEGGVASWSEGDPREAF